MLRGWEAFASRHGKGEPAFPAAPVLFVLYLQQLKDLAVSKGVKGSAVSDTVFAVDLNERLESAWCL